MSWRKHFTPFDNSGLPLNVQSPTEAGGPGAASSRYASWLPEVYAGSPNRLMRYIQYDQMDNDLEVNAALDTIAEFGTQEDEYTGLPFEVEFDSTPSDTENKILVQTLKNWCRLNKMHKRAFRMFRSVCKYGDQFFIRDPETYELMWIDPANIEKVIVNESEGKKIETYFIKNLEPNFAELVATDVAPLHSRDIAFSSNQNQLGLWGKALLGEDTNCTSAEDSFRYWCAAHKRLLSLLPHAKERIFLLRFESLVTQPNLVLKELARFLSMEINEKTLQQWHSALEVPATLGRYSGEAPFEIDQDQSQLLAQFGYSIC